MTMIKVPDVSYWNGKISESNMKKAAKEIGAIILRVGFTASNTKKPSKDSTFDTNYKSAIAAGVPVGVYYYSLATNSTMAKMEAEWVVKQLKGLKIDYPVYLDVEDPKTQGGCAKSTLAVVCNEFCKIVNKAGYIAGVYASTAWFKNKIGTITEPHTKWVAQYNTKCQYTGAHDAWQYTDGSYITYKPGGIGKCDGSYFYKDFSKVKTTIVKEIIKSNYAGKFPTLPFRGYFKVGDKSTQVKYLQMYLNWYGDYKISYGKYKLDEDGEYGKKTAEAVERFQQQRGLKIDGEFGEKSLTAAKNYVKNLKQPVSAPAPIEPKSYQGKFPTLRVEKTTQQVIDDAIRWAKWIAADDIFHYGYTSPDGSIQAHHNGCYFCGTNKTTGGRSKKGVVDYKFTYCCNPFVHAAWAHGGGVPSMLKKCKSGGSFGFIKTEGYYISSLFDNIGHPSMSKLKKGDVLCSNSHVALYIGNGKIAEASGGDDNKRNSTRWNNSIHITTMSESRYNSFLRVHRYIGTVSTTKAVCHGDINDQVLLTQKYLNWYGNYKLDKDGIAGDATVAAIKDFQKKEGLTIDGQFGFACLEKAKMIKK